MQVCYAENGQEEMYRVMKGSRCNETWLNLKWKNQRILYVDGDGQRYCVGTRTAAAKKAPGSQILSRASCKEDGFVHDFNFAPVALEPLAPPTVSLCIQPGTGEGVSVGIGPGGCAGGTNVLRYPVWIGQKGDDHSFCYCSSCSPEASGCFGSICRGSQCCDESSLVKVCFSVPPAAPRSRNMSCGSKRRQPLCIGKSATASPSIIMRLSEDCSGSMYDDFDYENDFTLWLPSKEDVLHSFTSPQQASLISLLHEDDDCKSFVCTDNQIAIERALTS